MKWDDIKRAKSDHISNMVKRYNSGKDLCPNTKLITYELRPY